MNNTETTSKAKLCAYLAISALSFLYLVMPQKAGISVPVFIIVQFICLWFIVPDKKPLLMFIPIFILALNSFISANNIWHIANFFVIAVLYSVMILMMTTKFPLWEPSINFILDIAAKIAIPFTFFDVPVKWGLEANQEQLKTIKRVLIGVGISIPCLIFLIVILSSADQIFSSSVQNVFEHLRAILNFTLIIKIIFSIVVGFYLFGLLYSISQPANEFQVNFNAKNGDLIIINIVLFSILFVYTIFALIQFRYLFASGAQLPYDLNYAHYARRGFFELLFLSGVNIFIILLTVKLTEKHTGTGAGLTKILCCYLCILTCVLLVSSFYRMWLYNFDLGLTRLRFLVFGFLIFEAVGLVFTFLYILKPKFNIIAIYLLIGLVYYVLLNIVPMDAAIAKSQIDRYFATGKGDLEYTLSLSPDAAPQIARLLQSDDSSVSKAAQTYFKQQDKQYNALVPCWQRYNLAMQKCLGIYERRISNAALAPESPVAAYGNGSAAEAKPILDIEPPPRDSVIDPAQAGLSTGMRMRSMGPAADY